MNQECCGGKSLTLTKIFPFRISGEGSFLHSCTSTLDRSNLSCSTSFRYSAIFFCWGTVQWFSIDKITGYLEMSQFHILRLLISLDVCQCQDTKALTVTLWRHICWLFRRRLWREFWRSKCNRDGWWVLHLVHPNSPLRVEIKTKKGWTCLSLLLQFLQTLTLHTATACLQNISIHFHPWLRKQLVSSQVCVVRRSNKVITERLCHILVDLVVLRVENITSRTSHVVGETSRELKKRFNS